MNKIKVVIILGFLTVMGLIFLTSCNKYDTECQFYTRGELYLEHSGECYYRQQGKKVYLEKEHCAHYCD